MNVRSTIAIVIDGTPTRERWPGTTLRVNPSYPGEVVASFHMDDNLSIYGQSPERIAEWLEEQAAEVRRQAAELEASTKDAA
jgi:hypothetical protein